MIRYLILRFLVPILIFFLLRSIIRTLAYGAGRRAAAAKPRPREVPASGELKKDPVCGTYVSTAVSITRTIGGKTVHFCSEDCSRKYRVAS
jgi:YHS domain-containing protein